MSVRTVLFDADGVIQRPTADRQDRWTALVGGAEPAVVGKFKTEIFAVERPCHDGSGDFLSELRGVLARWNCTERYDDALQTWVSIEVDRPVVELIGSMKATGVSCCLATNQEPYRARHMVERLHYGDLFDRLFFSCELGFSKPDPRYFEKILAALNLPADAVLFIDDTEANVAVARSLGMRAELFDAEAGPHAAEEMKRILSRHGVRP